jgi:integrase
MRGHIRKRGANSWELKYDTARVGGGRRTVYRSFRGSKREAQNELARLLTQVQDGTHTEPNKLTVAEHVRARVAQWRAAGINSTKTSERYQELVEYQIVPFLGTKLLQKLRSSDIEAWHSHLRTKGRHDGASGLSSRTIHHAHRIVVKALHEAVRHGLVFKNVAIEERPPKVTGEKMQILTPEQVNALPAMLAGRPICAPALTALFTGVRRGELLALRWDNVDLERKIMRIIESLDETVQYGIRFKPTKTKSGQREISLPDIVIDILRNHRREQLELRLALGLGKAPEDALVFPAPGSDCPWGPNSFSPAWSDVATKLGLNVSFHSLRHTHASQLIDAGVDVVTISKRLGHSSPAITLSVYAHLFRKDDSKAAAAINAAFKR